MSVEILPSGFGVKEALRTLTRGSRLPYEGVFTAAHKWAVKTHIQ